MGLEFGDIVRSFIGKNRGAEKETQLFQVELAEKGDAQTIEELHVPGVQYVPAENSKGFVGRVASMAFKVFTSINDQIPKEDLAAGERLFYSDDGLVIKARIYLTKDGKIGIGNGTDELIDLFYQTLTELQKTVDLSGAASTGTLFKINPALATIQSKLANIKI